MQILNFSRLFVPPALAATALIAPFHGAQATAKFSVVYAFCQQSQTNCADGSTPEGGLLADQSGNLYGTTYYGGANDYGTVFEVAADRAETVLYSFCPEAQDKEPCNDGALPSASLIESGGNLYGTTASGGEKNRGTVFEISSGGTETVLYSFCSQEHCSDGARPLAGLVMDSEGNLYGTTYEGGNANCPKGCGTVFELASGGAESVLYPFCSETKCADGAHPTAPLELSSGSLYGTTEQGGAANRGTVFEISSGNAETVLYSFCGRKSCADGAEPTAGIVMDTSGDLYGTTSRGGNPNCPAGCGTVFELAASGSESVLYAFCPKGTCPDGAEPGTGELLIAGNGNTLYGTTDAGGKDGFGTAFMLSGGTETVLHSFNNEDGEPSAGLIAVNGDLYGTTFGSFYQNEFGVVFKLGTADGRSR